MTIRRGRGLAATLILGAFAASVAATPLSEIRLSPDVAVSLGASTVDDEQLAADVSGAVSVLSLAGIPSEAELDAYAVRANGHVLMSFENTLTLPGGLVAAPGDVVRYDGVTRALEFAAAPIGVPSPVNTDAVAVLDTKLLLSFDTAFDINTLHIEPEDLIQFDGALFTMFFDGSAAGVAPGLDLDAAEYLPCNGHLLLSFDGTGSIGGLDFDDEDVLEFDGVATWQMAYDASVHDPAWSGVDLDAVSAKVDLGPGPPQVFGQTVRVDANKTTIRWPASVAFRAVRGAFTTSASVGAYTVNAEFTGTGTTFNDAALPAPGIGAWYLVKRTGCTQTSWQSTLGQEPGRDAAIP